MNKWWVIAGMWWLMVPGSVKGAEAVSLKFSPSSLNLNYNSSGVVGVWMESGTKPVVGVDLVVRFDKSKIKIVEAGSEGVFTAITGQKIDNGNGLFRLSLSNNYGVYSSGNKAIAWFRIKSFQSSGDAKLSMDFTPGKTADSNVVLKNGEEALTQVGDIQIMISGTTGETPGGTAETRAVSTPRPAQTTSRTEEAQSLANVAPTAGSNPGGPNNPIPAFETEEREKVLGLRTTNRTPDKPNYGWWIFGVIEMGLLAGAVWLRYTDSKHNSNKISKGRTIGFDRVEQV